MAKRNHRFIEAAGPRVPALSVALRLEIFTRAMSFSTYWFRISERGTRGHLDKHIWMYDTDIMFQHVRQGMEIPVVFQETGKRIGMLHGGKFAIGEQLMCSDPDGLAVYARFLDGTWDAQDADTWLQFVVLGEVKYS